MNYSRQREAIISFLMTRKDHPTAEVIYQNVRIEYPRISLGTVYRNLAQLSENGDILRLQLGDGFDHFDYDTSPHDHFICRKCGAVIDLPTRIHYEIKESEAGDFKGTIEGFTTYFYGMCPECKV